MRVAQMQARMEPVGTEHPVLCYFRSRGHDLEVDTPGRFPGGPRHLPELLCVQQACPANLPEGLGHL